MGNTTDVTVYEDRSLSLHEKRSVFEDMESFAFAQRVAKMLSESDMIPSHFQSKKNPNQGIANIMIALDYAKAVGANPFMIMKSMYPVHGNIGIDAKLLIALFNTSRKFGPMQYEITGDVSDPRDGIGGCTAYAVDMRTGTKLKGPKVSWAMVKSEGWLGRAGSKWKTMPDVMFRYRAATLFVRLYAPELAFGMHTADEIADMHADNEGTYVVNDRPDNSAEEAKKKEEIKGKKFEEIYTIVDAPKAAATTPEPQKEQPQQLKQTPPPQHARHTPANADNRPPDGVDLAGNPIKPLQPTINNDIATALNSLEIDFGKPAVNKAGRNMGVAMPPRAMAIIDRLRAECTRQRELIANGF